MSTLHAGVIASAVANFGFKELREPLGPHDFFNGLPEPEPEQQSDESILAFFQTLAAAQQRASSV